MAGGGWGKASVCPKDAAEANQLWEEANKQPITGNYMIAIRIQALYQ